MTPFDPGEDARDPRLTATRLAAFDLRLMLEDYYSGADVLHQTWLLQPGEPSYEAGIDWLADKIARAFVWRAPFVIGTVGSSVTAAHGNCHNDSYQRQLERVMAPVWSAAELPFEVRNAGQGGACGDSYENQIWCLGSLVGDDIDIVHYSWTYFEVGSPQVENFHEMFYRWSLLLDHAPAPQLLYASNCSRLSELDRQLVETYAPFGVDVLCMERGIRARGYPGKKWGVVGDTLHETTREGEMPGISQERRQSLGVVYRNWHPGPLLFQTTADALAYRYTTALLRALDQIEMCQEPRRRWPRRPVLERDRLPAPQTCSRDWCDAPRPPACLVYGDPVLGSTDAELVVAGDPASSNSAGFEVAGWQMWRQPSPPRFVPEAARDRPECAHPTACGGPRVKAGKQAGWLTFRLPDLELGFVAICCSGKQCGKRLLELEPELSINGMPGAEPEVLWSGKCVQIQPRFTGPEGHPQTVDVAIRFQKSDRPSPVITHVIGL
jgi:hypothetical protein